MASNTNLRISISTLITIVGSILSLSSYAILAKTLKPSEFINITSTLSVFLVLWEVYDFGRSTVLLRNFESKNLSASKFESHIMRRKIRLFLVFATATLLINSLLSDCNLFYLIYLGGTSFLQSLNLTANVYFRKSNNLILNSLNNFSEKVVLFVLVLIFHSSITEVSIVFLISSGISFIATYSNRIIYGNPIKLQFKEKIKVDKSLRIGLANSIRILGQLDLFFLNFIFGPTSDLVTYTLMTRYANAAQTASSQFLSSFQNLSLIYSRAKVWLEHKFFIRLGATLIGIFLVTFVFLKPLQKVLLPNEERPIPIIVLLIIWIVLEILASMWSAQMISEKIDIGFFASQMTFIITFFPLVALLTESVPAAPIALARILALIANLLVMQFFLNSNWFFQNDK